MALVFKIKFEDTLRRWVVSERFEETGIVLSIQDLEAKIRELFHISPTAALVVTYVDKENDVVTLADDQDLVDACLVQRLNPLRLDVKLREDVKAREELPESSTRSAARPSTSAEDINAESFLKLVFPEATADAVRQFLSKSAQLVGPRSPAAVLRKLLDDFNEFLKTLLHQDGLPTHDKARASATTFENHRDSFRHHHGFYPRGRGGKGGSPRTFHRGVQCDGCGMSPIEGHRFKSLKTLNYDLCSSCFEAMGNEADYEKIEYPQFHGFHHPPCPARGMRHHMAPAPPRPSFARGPYGWKPECPFRMQPPPFSQSGEMFGKLDARFVKDVTIFDGTELAPDTKFTKIWRLRNTGTVPWPQNSQLIFIGGDALCSQDAVNLELPEGGLPCEEDVEVSVDLTAPERAGRYVSHWRLMSPSGQKFGHRVWVVIQVVPQGEQSPQLQESLKGGEETERVEEAVILGAEKGVETGSNSGEGHIASVTTNFDMKEVKEVEGSDVLASGMKNLTVEDVGQGIIINGPTEYAAADENATSVALKEVEQNIETVNNELDGFSVVEKPIENVEWYNVLLQGVGAEKQAFSGEQTGFLQEQFVENIMKDVSKKNHEIEVQLQLLDSMGFKNQDLNALLLEKNNEDLQRTLDDLLVAAGWDSVLKDLQEMGFSDEHTNLRLLIKNQGSIKLVVKNLVEMEKQKAGGKWNSDVSL